MKKIILLSAVGALAAFGASAQSANSPVNVKAGRGVDASIPAITLPSTGSALKTTAPGFRRYDHQEYAASISTTTFQGISVPIWQDSTVRVGYTGGIGSINFTSVAQSFYPFDALWNDAANPNFLGKIAVTATNSYQVDSVRLLGYYLLGNLTGGTMATQVDTLEISVATQPAGNTYYWRGSVSSWALPYLPSGKDTLFCSTPINVDSIRKSALSNPTTSPRQTWKVPLTPAMRISAAEWISKIDEILFIEDLSDKFTQANQNLFL